jgi:hypothetical protein
VRATKGLARVVKAAQIGGVRLVEANAKTRVRSVQEVGDDAGLILSYRGSVKEGPDERGVFYVVARVDAKVNSAEEPKAEPLVSVSVAFELKYRLPQGFRVSKEELQAFAAVNGVFNAWPYFREIIQSATARMNLPPIILPLHRALKPAKVPRRALAPAPQKGEKE